MRMTILLVLLLSCGEALAANWVLINAHNGSWLYYDADGILVSGQIRRAWLKINYRPHTERGNESNPNKFLASLAYRAAFNCGEGTRRIEIYTGYYEDGTMDTEDKTTSAAWEQIVPDTEAYKEMHIICAWKKHFWDF
jgi:hypothetical protein